MSRNELVTFCYQPPAMRRASSRAPICIGVGQKGTVIATPNTAAGFLTVGFACIVVGLFLAALEEG